MKFKATLVECSQLQSQKKGKPKVEQDTGETPARETYSGI